MSAELLLYKFIQGSEIEEITAALIDLELQDLSRATIFNIHSGNAKGIILKRLKTFLSIYPDFVQLCHDLKLVPIPIVSLWTVWLPLAIQLAEWREQQQHPLIQGFLGGQGVGKTTLTLLLTLILRHLDYQAVSFSLDDLYLPYHDRLQLQQQDPRFIRRGPPGTHDVDLGIQVLQQLRQQQFPVLIPQFDKSAWNGSGDRTDGKIVTSADIVLFEGWFVGVQPIDPVIFETAPAPITTEVDRQFARDINVRLRDYLPLWELLDRLIVLYAPNYQLSKLWRQQAEHQTIAQRKAGMTDAEIDDFVEYFWKALHPKLFIQPLLKDSKRVDIMLEIDSHHQPKVVCYSR